MVWLISILCVIGFVLLFPIKISVQYAFSHSADKRIFLIKIFAFSVYRSENGENKEEKKEKSCVENEKKISLDDVKKFVALWRDKKAETKKNIKKILKNIKRFANLKKAETDIAFGTGDAAQTGIAGGILYGFVYGVFSEIYYVFNIKKKNIQIDLKPDFNREGAEVYLNFEFKARLIFALFALYWIAKMYFLLKKEVK